MDNEKLFLAVHPIENFTEITNQEEMDTFLDWVGGFHDGLVKEWHAVNDAFIDESLGMVCVSRLNMRLLIQRQCPNPSAVELLFGGVTRCTLWHTGDIYEGNGTVTYRKRDEVREIVVELDGMKIEANRLLYRDASDWMGPESRFGEEIVLEHDPSIRDLGDGVFLCEHCSSAWEKKGRTILRCHRCSYSGVGYKSTGSSCADIE